MIRYKIAALHVYDEKNLINSNLFSLGSSANNARNFNETQPQAVGAWSSWKRAISSMRENGWDP